MADFLVVRPGHGRLLDLGNFEAVVLATGADTEEQFSLLQTQNEPTDFGPPMHVHSDAAEAFYVLDGEYLMFIDEHQERCPPGTFVYVPRGVAHTFRVVSATPGRKLNLFTPAAMVGFFEDLSAAEADGTATPDVLDEIATRHSMNVVGPVPATYL
jgi:mannose-6-phosphate isomerase-like protein (cupin superfamily)